MQNNNTNTSFDQKFLLENKSKEIASNLSNTSDTNIAFENGVIKNFLYQEQDLLDYDQTSSDEEILGESFNIRYQNKNRESKFIPANKIHKIFTQHENAYRKQFYEKSQGVIQHANGQEELYASYYNEIERSILKPQEKLREDKQNFKKKLGRYKCKDSQDIQMLKEQKIYTDAKTEIIERLHELIDHPTILKVKKSADQPNGVYPNFAIAQIDYVKGGKVLSQLLTDVKGDGHSEKQIFDHTYKTIKENENIRASELIILNMHSTLSICNTCNEDAKELISKIKELTNKNNFKINISYKFPYTTNDPTKEDRESVFQQQIEIGNIIDHDQMIFDNIIPSSGYHHSPKHKAAIEYLSPKKKQQDMSDLELSRPSCSKALTFDDTNQMDNTNMIGEIIDQ